MRKIVEIALAGASAITIVLCLVVPARSGIVAAPWNPNPPPELGPTTITHFEAGSLIFPTDQCYARSSFISGAEQEAIVDEMYGPSATANSVRCNRNSEKDNGLIPTYTMLQRLILAGVPVHWALRAGKTGWNDHDFAITKAGGGPVTWMNKSGSTDNRFSSVVQIRYAGSAYIIDKAHAATAKSLMATYYQSDTGTDYGDIDIHEAQIDFDAPIYQTMGGLPKLAVIDLGDAATGLQNQQTNFLLSSIQEALMSDLENQVWFRVTIPQVKAGALISGGYSLVWVPSFDLTGPPTPQQAAFFNALKAYVSNGGHILFQDGAIAVMEGYGSWSGGYVQNLAPVSGYQSDGGLIVNGASGTWDNGNANETTIAQDYSDPAAQFGGSVWTGVGGSKYNWKPRYDKKYHNGVRRMIYTKHASDTSKDDWDIATWRHLDNDSTKGRIYYLGGYNWRRVTASGFRILMNTVFVHSTPPGDNIVEISRSAPIVTTVDGIELFHQGTFEYDTTSPTRTTYNGSADDTTFVFPFVPGHLRAIPTSEITGTETDFDDFNALWDAADKLPSASPAGCAVTFDGSCRTIFTNIDAGTIGGARPTVKQFHTGNRADLKPLLAPGLTDAENDTLITKVLEGKLGGVDRSTMAIIEPSPLTQAARPTMVYFGAMDGMLHAVCGDTVGSCPSKGTELWAFIPRTQLPLLRKNTQMVQGSIKVDEVFVDVDGDGRNEWRTVLTFQVGMGDETTSAEAPAVYGIDITDPTAPKVLWEYSAYSDGTRSDVDMGVGHTLSMGPVATTTGLKYAVFVQTNNGGISPSSGMWVAALDVTSGEPLYTWTKKYDNPRNPLNPSVPDSAIPGGITAVDYVGQTSINRLLVPSLYGELWVLNALNGTSAHKDGSGNEIPLFRFSTDFKPIGAPASVYFHPTSGTLHAIIVSGGYADNDYPTTWAPTNVIQQGVSMPVRLAASITKPFDETTVLANQGAVVDFGPGERAFAQAVVVGNEVFIVTDTDDVNSATYGTGSASGLLRRYSLNNFAAPAVGQVTINIQGGASSVDATKSGVVYSGSAKSAKKTTINGFDANGRSTELNQASSYERKLWLQLR